MESRDNDEQQPFRTSRELPLDTVCYSKRCVLGDMSIYSEFFCLLPDLATLACKLIGHRKIEIANSLWLM